MRWTIPLFRWTTPLLLVFAAACKDSDGDGVRDGKDCDENDAAVYPDAEEICDRKDNDCDGVVDEDVDIVAYLDRDGDGFGDDVEGPRRVCEMPADGTEVPGDCNDDDPDAYPGAEEICDEIDNDCDDQVDEDAGITLYQDSDGDGHGDPGITSVACAASTGWTLLNDDCDDSDPEAWTDRPEECDARDNDCDGQIDEGTSPTLVWEDRDGDGFGDPNRPLVGCAAAPGVSGNDLDCDDNDPARNPDAEDVPSNGIDEDCDGWTDELAVPVPYATVADALVVASSGDVIQIDGIVHVESVDMQGHNVTLAGEGCDRTTLYGDGQGTVVQMDTGGLTGMTVSGGIGTDTGSGLRSGGGVLVRGNVEIWDACVVSNTADGFGGGIAVWAGNLNLHDSVLSNNFAENHGGGLYLAENTRLTAERVTFAENDANTSGGAMGSEGATSTVHNSVFVNNVAAHRGGGIFFDSMADNSGPVPVHNPSLGTVSNSTFHGNATDPSAVVSAQGQAMVVVASRVDVTASLFTGHLEDLPVLDDGNRGTSENGRGRLGVHECGFSGNTGPDHEDHYVVASLRGAPGYANTDPALAAVDWDLRLGPDSAFLNNGPQDSDGDGLRDQHEQVLGTDPLMADSDGGGVPDFYEVHPDMATDPLNGADDVWDTADTDGDGLTNFQEGVHRLDPFSPDTDGDGVLDGAEDLFGSWEDPDGSRNDIGASGGPLAGADFDFARVADFDGDGMLDAWEARWGTNPFLEDDADDLDGDGLDNGTEHTARTNPGVADTDGDGVDDLTEQTAGTDPTRPQDHMPVADAGADRYVWVGNSQALDGSASYDPTNDALTYDWRVVLVPGGSSVVNVDDPALPVTALTPDAAGTYEIELTVDDGSTSASDLIVLRAVTGEVVPDYHPTIAAAVAAAAPGAGIGLRPGTYAGPHDLGAADVTLIGLGADPADVVLDGGGASRVVSADAGSVVALSNLTVAGGSASEGAGIMATDGGQLSLSHVVVRDNSASLGGGGVYALRTPLDVDHVWFLDNHAVSTDGGAVLVDTADALITQSVFGGNTAANRGGALHLFRLNNTGTPPDWNVHANVFQYNAAASGAAVYQDGVASDALLFHNTFTRHSGGSVVYDALGRLQLIDLLMMDNQTGLLVDGMPIAAIFPFGSITWQNTGPTWYAGAGLPAIAGEFRELDPQVPVYLDDGDATNDLFAALDGSPMLDGGLFDLSDPDGSRADVGPCGGAWALPRCQRLILDADGDGLPDGWEYFFALDTSVDDGSLDTDGDGLTNINELLAGTDPTEADSDGDGVADNVELLGGSDPTSAQDHAPVADAGGPYSVFPAELTTLDGTGSSDPDSDPLTYEWRIVAAPSGSAITTADLDDPTSATPSFTPDLPGYYGAALVVSDGFSFSAESLAQVLVFTYLEVPSVYATVEEAIDEAGPGDIIRLGPGTHTISLRLVAASDFVRITGHGVDQTMVHGEPALPVLLQKNGSTVELSNLTLAESNFSDGGALRCEFSNLTLDGVRIRDSVARAGAAAWLWGCSTVFDGVEIVDNETTGTGAALWVKEGDLTIVNSVLARNTSLFGTAGALYNDFAAVTLRNVVFAHNSAFGAAGAVWNFRGTVDVRYSTFVGNTGNDGAIVYSEDLTNPGSMTVSHNLFVGNSDYGYYQPNGSTLQAVDHNGYFANGTGAAFPVGLGAGADDVSADPVFVAWDAAGDGSTDDLRLDGTSPMLDLGTGLDPDGSASDYGAFGGPGAPIDFDLYIRDSDSDAMPDGWEIDHGLNPAVSSSGGDPDSDGIDNGTEYLLGTDPQDTDSDNDGVPDVTEALGATDPADPTDNRPTADAGPNELGSVGNLATLTGSGSDPNSDPLAYLWRFLDIPGRSQLDDTDLTGATTTAVSFTPDTGGLYRLELVTHDGTVFSEPSTAFVRVRGDVMVPEDYATVGEAVASMRNDYVLTVGPGTWDAELDLDDRDITIIGAGQGATTLLGTRRGPVVSGVKNEIVEIRDLTIRNGLATDGGGIVSRGGAVTLVDVTIVGNSAVRGGGVFAGNSAVTMQNVRIVANDSGLTGGGLHFEANTIADLQQTLIAGNLAETSHGGAIYAMKSDLMVTNAVFADNHAWSGGALWINGDATTPGLADFDHVTAVFNSAHDNSPTAPRGAVLHVETADVTVHNSVFESNGPGPAVFIEEPSGADYLQTYSGLGNHATGHFSGFMTVLEPMDGTDGNVLLAGPFGVDASDDGDWTNDSWDLFGASPGVDGGDPASPNDVDATRADMGAFGGPGGGWMP